MTQFKLQDNVRWLTGEKDYTIADALETGKGKLVVRNDYTTNFKNVYYYKEGIFLMRVNGNQARTYAKNHNLTIGKD